MDAGPSAVILFVRRPVSDRAITHTGVGCRRWRSSGHVRCNFVCSQVGFRCAITHTGVACGRRRRSGHVRCNFVRSQVGFRCATTHTGIGGDRRRRPSHVRCNFRSQFPMESRALASAGTAITHLVILSMTPVARGAAVTRVSGRPGSKSPGGV